MPDTLAQRVRAKYPGAYDDMSDPQLEAAVTAKFPGVYDDLPRSTPTAQTPLWRQAMPTVAGVVDAALGARAGMTRTGVEIADVGRRLVGGSRLSENPEIQAQMTPPESLAGQVGYGGERLAEFIVPALRVGKAMQAAPWFGRTMAQAGTAAGVMGAQTGGDPASMIGAAGLGAAGETVFGVAGAGVRAARQAAAGAREGGLGGAVARTIRAVAPDEPIAMVTQALKPRAINTNWGKTLTRALPEIKASEAALGRPVSTIDDFTDAVGIAKRRIRAQYDEMAGPMRAGRWEVDLSPVADAMERSIPKKLQLEHPGEALRLQESAKVYRQSFSLDDAEQLLKETNADMEAFYNKYPVAQRRALTADPEWARLNAQAQAMRTAIYSRLDEAGGGAAARELQRRYGSLLDVELEASRRANVAKRQQPESLSEQLSSARAAMEIARGTWRVIRGDLTGAADIVGGVAMRDTAKFLKEQQTTDALIRRALASVRQMPEPVVMPAHRPVRGYLERGPVSIEPPTDPSFVRGVPAMAQPGGRRALPPPARPMPAHDVSGGRGVSARPTVQRDPRTGRMRRIYLGEGR